MMRTSIDEIIKKATEGNPEAMQFLVELYMPLFNKYSVIDSQFDQDLKQQLIHEVIQEIRRFKKYYKSE